MKLKTQSKIENRIPSCIPGCLTKLTSMGSLAKHYKKCKVLAAEVKAGNNIKTMEKLLYEHNQSLHTTKNPNVLQYCNICQSISVVAGNKGCLSGGCQNEQKLVEPEPVHQRNATHQTTTLQNIELHSQERNPFMFALYLGLISIEDIHMGSRLQDVSNAMNSDFNNHLKGSDLQEARSAYTTRYANLHYKTQGKFLSEALTTIQHLKNLYPAECKIVFK
jgi:hypothetical protein